MDWSAIRGRARVEKAGLSVPHGLKEPKRMLAPKANRSLALEPSADFGGRINAS